MRHTKAPALAVTTADASRPAAPAELRLTVGPLGIPDPLAAGLALVLYLGLEWLSFLHDHDGLPVTPWNPGLGVMLALIVAGGPLYGLVLLVGVVLAEMTIVDTALSVSSATAVGVMVAASYTLVGVIMRGRLQIDRQVLHTRDVVIIAVGALGGALLTSSLLIAVLLSLRVLGLADIARTAAPLILGDTIGIVVATPLVLRLLALRVAGRPLPTTPGIADAGLALAIVVLLVVTTWPTLPLQTLFYLLFLPVVLAAMRHGIDGACASLALVQIGLVAILHFHGLDLSRFTEYQFLMLMLTLTGLVVGALVSERLLADEATRKATARLQALQVEATQSSRLNLVSGMAAALAHEVNQPLTAARALARSAERRIAGPDPDLPRAAVNIARMVEQIDLAGDIVRRMREFLRRGEPHLSTLDVGGLLNDAAALMSLLTKPRGIAVHIDVEEGLPCVAGDRVQIQQVVMNLVRNAVDAIAEARSTGGLISIAAHATPDRREVVVSVVDTGAGIAPERIARLFEPLQTSRAEGLGLGLAICQSIVQAHGGRIWLEASSPGRTEFRFTIPL